MVLAEQQNIIEIGWVYLPEGDESIAAVIRELNEGLDRTSLQPIAIAERKMVGLAGPNDLLQIAADWPVWQKILAAISTVYLTAMISEAGKTSWAPIYASIKTTFGALARFSGTWIRRGFDVQFAFRDKKELDEHRMSRMSCYSPVTAEEPVQFASGLYQFVSRYGRILEGTSVRGLECLFCTNSQIPDPGDAPETRFLKNCHAFTRQFTCDVSLDPESTRAFWLAALSRGFASFGDITLVDDSDFDVVTIKLISDPSFADKIQTLECIGVIIDLNNSRELAAIVNSAARMRVIVTMGASYEHSLIRRIQLMNSGNPNPIVILSRVDDRVPGLRGLVLRNGQPEEYVELND